MRNDVLQRCLALCLDALGLPYCNTVSMIGTCTCDLSGCSLLLLVSIYLSCVSRPTERQQRQAIRTLPVNQRASPARRARRAHPLEWAKGLPSSGASYTAPHPSGHQTATRLLPTVPQVTRLVRWCSWHSSCTALGKKRQGRLVYLRFWVKRLGLCTDALSYSCSRPCRCACCSLLACCFWAHRLLLCHSMA